MVANSPLTPPPNPVPGPWPGTRDPASQPPATPTGPAPSGHEGDAGRPAWDPRQVRRHLLALDNRRRIVDHVADHPGIHLRQVARDLALAVGTTEHHLHLLVRHRLLERHRLQGQTGYFLAGTTTPDERLLWAVLRQDGPRQVLRALAADGDLDAPAMAVRLGLSRATAAHHVQRLVALGLLQRLRVGRRHLLRLADPEGLAVALRLLDGVAPSHPWPGSILDAALRPARVRHRSGHRPPAVHRVPALGGVCDRLEEVLRSSSP